MTDDYLPALHVLKIIAVVTRISLSVRDYFTQKELLSLCPLSQPTKSVTKTLEKKNKFPKKSAEMRVFLAIWVTVAVVCGFKVRNSGVRFRATDISATNRLKRNGNRLLSSTRVQQPSRRQVYARKGSIIQKNRGSRFLLFRVAGILYRNSIGKLVTLIVGLLLGLLGQVRRYAVGSPDGKRGGDTKYRKFDTSRRYSTVVGGEDGGVWLGGKSGAATAAQLQMAAQMKQELRKQTSVTNDLLKARRIVADKLMDIERDIKDTRVKEVAALPVVEVEVPVAGPVVVIAETEGETETHPEHLTALEPVPVTNAEPVTVSASLPAPVPAPAPAPVMDLVLGMAHDLSPVSDAGGDDMRSLPTAYSYPKSRIEREAVDMSTATEGVDAMQGMWGRSSHQEQEQGRNSNWSIMEFVAAMKRPGSMEEIKASGVSGIIAYVGTELGFWAVSLPVVVASYHASTGDWLDFSDPEQRGTILGLSAGFVTSIRLTEPLRLYVALSIIPWVKENITKQFLFKNTKD
jgi:hypothetical protein